MDEEQRPMMIETRIPVIESDNRTHASECLATRVGPEGMEFCTDIPPTGRFTWLEFELPGDERRIKALGEVVDVQHGPDRDRVQVRFKHLFPRDRVAMNTFCHARAAA
jgi:hypothetical protein